MKNKTAAIVVLQVALILIGVIAGSILSVRTDLVGCGENIRGENYRRL